MPEPARRDPFEALLEEQWQRLWSFALRLTRDRVQAEDLLNATATRALSRFDSLRDDAAFPGWCTRIMVNLWRNQLNKASTRREQVGLDNVIPLDPTQATPEQAVNRDRLGVLLQAALDELPEDHRAAIWLVDVQGFSYPEAAEILDVARGTVASRVARARHTLRVSLQQVAIEQEVVR